MLKKIISICLIAIAFLIINISPTLADSVDGGAIFQANCAGCHAKGGNIVRRGKTLKAKALKRNHVDSQEAVVSLVTNGKGIMSAYGDRLTEEEIAAVSQYVLDRAAVDWH